MVAYLALVRRYGAADYCVEFPDFPHCVAAGAGPEEAEMRARRALASHVDRLIADGEGLPVPSLTDPDAVERSNPEVAAFLVEVGSECGALDPDIAAPANENTLAQFIATRLAEAVTRGRA